MEIDIFKILSFFNPFTSLVIIFFLTILILTLYIMNKMQTISLLKGQVNRLNNIVKDLDQQAKLIIKGDMELRLYQQEIEDKLNKLTLIKNLILSSIHILDREKLFFQINENIINPLGFKRGLILDFNELEIKANVDFGPEDTERVRNIFKYKKDILKGIQILPNDSDLYKQISSELGTKAIMVAPIKVRDSVYAICIVADLLEAAVIRRSDEEAFLIICMYFSQCLDNIDLFENLYHNRDELEKKIKERTNELVKSLREIETISKAKSTFISSVSHELRTPLTSVKGFSSLLVDEKFGKLPEEAKKRLERVDDNVNKLMDIVNTLLDISRIESGKMEIKIVPFEIIKIIKDVTEFLSPQIEAKGLKLTLDLPEKLNVYIDKTLIERVLTNLINNAIKFTPSGGKIEVKCKQQDSEAVISVADNGYGIKKDEVDKIFQEFFRAQTPVSGPIKGSGLGLSLVKRIIDTHKERIWVESGFGKGTTFYFTLKVVE